MEHSNIYGPRHLVITNIYEISRFNFCSTMTTLQGLATISEVFAGFNVSVIQTGLVSCLINVSQCMQNAPLRRKFKKISGEGHRPSPVGERIPPPKKNIGVSILDPSPAGQISQIESCVYYVILKYNFVLLMITFNRSIETFLSIR